MLCLAGQIKSFHGPHLARGPYVVHACIKALDLLNLFCLADPLVSYQYLAAPLDVKTGQNNIKFKN